MVPKYTRGDQKQLGGICHTILEDLPGSGRRSPSTGTAEPYDHEADGICPEVQSKGEGSDLETDNGNCSECVGGVVCDNGKDGFPNPSDPTGHSPGGNGSGPKLRKLVAVSPEVSQTFGG